MKNFSSLLVVAAMLTTSFHFAQEQNQDISLTAKDSIVASSWTFGLGYNFVDDSGDVFDGLLDFKSQWNALPYPNRLSIGRNFKSGFGVELIGTLNRYKAGKIIEKAINESDIPYWAVDTRLSYDLNKLIGDTRWFDPYVGLGLGYTNANNISRGTFNGVIGFRTWFSDRLGLDLSSSGKWSIGQTASNHLQHAAGVVYRFGIEKELSKKGKEKLALLEALEHEKQRVNDSINTAREIQEAEALAQRLAEEKERARLAAMEKSKLDKEHQRKEDIRTSIDALGFVYFDLNSSYLKPKSKHILDRLTVILEQNPNLRLQISSHTDSRGKSKYNMWLSERRVNRTLAYLVEKGIDATRLNTEAFGEDKLLNHCDDTTYCSEEEHQVNRRSEFIITDF